MSKKSEAIKEMRAKLPQLQKVATEMFKIRLFSEVIKNESKGWEQND